MCVGLNASSVCVCPHGAEGPGDPVTRRGSQDADIRLQISAKNPFIVDLRLFMGFVDNNQNLTRADLGK